MLCSLTGGGRLLPVPLISWNPSASQFSSQPARLHFSVTKKFLEVSRCSRVKQRQRNVKKVCCKCKVAFLLIRHIVVFHRSPALPSPLSITRLYILCERKYYRELRFEPWLNLYIIFHIQKLYIQPLCMMTYFDAWCEFRGKYNLASREKVLFY